MYVITMLDNDNGTKWTEEYQSLTEFENALAHYGAKYNGSNNVTLVW